MNRFGWMIHGVLILAAVFSVAYGEELLPEEDGVVMVATQPTGSDERDVKVYVTYPGGELSQVTRQTGIMLSLHNWGGTGAIGTANPEFLANEYNLVVVGVDYLHSGKMSSTKPYDCGYLQAIDSLRGLWFVFSSLDERKIPFARGRIYATGGSGGGNVALMANKFAPRTFACVIDCSGMCKLSDDIAYDLPGGTRLNAGYSRDPNRPAFLSPDAQEIRWIGNPAHLKVMKELGNRCRVVVSHGTTDDACPVADAKEMVTNMQTAGLVIEPHFIKDENVDGKIIRNTGHSVGDRTKIVDLFAGKYLSSDSPDALVRHTKCDFDCCDEVVRYPTSNGVYVVSYLDGGPTVRFRKTNE